MATYASLATVHRHPVHHDGLFRHVSLDIKVRIASSGVAGRGWDVMGAWMGMGKRRKRAARVVSDEAESWRSLSIS